MADSLAREITRRGFLVKIGQGLVTPNVGKDPFRESWKV